MTLKHYLCLFSFFPMAAMAAPQFDEGQLTAWYKGDLYNDPARGTYEPKPSLGKFRGTNNFFPRQTGSGARRYHMIMICSGAGCPIKMKHTITLPMINELKAVHAAEAAKCETYNASCELKALRKTVNKFERMILRDLLKPAPYEKVAASYVHEGSPGVKQHLNPIDCVDQSTNGITYLVVLAREGMMKLHRVIEPGYEGGVHFFTRIQNISTGSIYKFDLYHRGIIDPPDYIPYVKCYSGCDRR